MSGEKFMHSMPCQRVNTVGYFFGSVLNFTVAPAATYRFTRDSRVTGPVRKVPLGTTTRPPPALLHAWTALRNAAVLSALPSPLAPYEVIAKSRSGKTGGLIRSRIAGT